MKLHAMWSTLCLLFLSGCATEANFTKALDEAAKVSAAAKLVTGAAERDAMKAKLLQLYGSKIAVSDLKATGEAAAELACNPVFPIEASGTALAAFGDAIDAIHKVGEKPADTSYASYVTQFRKNAKNIAEAKAKGLQATMDAGDEAAQKERDLAVTRCKTLYLADIKAVLGPTSGGIGASNASGTAVLFAFNELIKGALAAGEAAQRETAVIETTKALVPGLERAHGNLAKPISKDFQPFVQYDGLPSNHPALVGNGTLLGATVTLHRWFIAQQISKSGERLAACKLACLGDPLARQNLDDLTIAMEQYRSLATIDPEKTLDALAKGIAGGKKAADGKVSWPQALDGLLQIVDTLSGLGDKFGAYQKSRE
ncbi:hypothetical protein [Massilia antarctica]|uniref:hypothetical protein n=1 Tax=Massilia antarctica TaxID=2765360 RepID=UPI0035EF4C4F